MLLNCVCTSESTHPEGLQHGDRSCYTSLIRVDLVDRRARGRWLVSQQPRLVRRDSVPRLHTAEVSLALARDQSDTDLIYYLVFTVVLTLLPSSDETCVYIARLMWGQCLPEVNHTFIPFCNGY